MKQSVQLRSHAITVADDLAGTRESRCDGSAGRRRRRRNWRAACWLRPRRRCAHLDAATTSRGADAAGSAGACAGWPGAGHRARMAFARAIQSDAAPTAGEPRTATSLVLNAARPETPVRSNEDIESAGSTVRGGHRSPRWPSWLGDCARLRRRPSARRPPPRLRPRQAEEAEHPGHLGRRHRPVQHQRLQPAA
ncbi:MAG: hypothetical protein MZV70_07945 [Desulfobacterales bacterium]|nr:hypothetical protein [Desulfobacterales bacterium]